jgi:hypothetical protein
MNAQHTHKAWKATLEGIKKDADVVHRTMSLLSHGANVSQQSLEHAEEFFKKLKTL